MVELKTQYISLINSDIHKYKNHTLDLKGHTYLSISLNELQFTNTTVVYLLVDIQVKYMGRFAFHFKKLAYPLISCQLHGYIQLTCIVMSVWRLVQMLEVKRWI
jgi:hypothetical protein